MKRKIKMGNDGYGNKNITVTKYKHYISISSSDSHAFGRTTTVTIPSDDINTLIEFLSQVKFTDKVVRDNEEAIELKRMEKWVKKCHAIID